MGIQLMDVLNFGLFAPKKKTADSITGIQSQVNALLAGAGIFEGVVNTYAELPDAALHSSRIWTVKTATGFPFINKRESGLYLSDGASWVFLDSSNTELAKYTVNGDSLVTENLNVVSGTGIQVLLDQPLSRITISATQNPELAKYTVGGTSLVTDNLTVEAGSNVSLALDTLLNKLTISSAFASVSGDVKSGFQAADHAGWYKLDGRAVSTLSTTARAAAVALGFITSLPNANDAYLSQTSVAGDLGSISSSNSFTLARFHLPKFTLSGTTTSAGGHSHNFNLGYIVQYSGNGFALSTPSAGGGSQTTLTDGVHTHNLVTENLNDSSIQQAIDLRPKTLKANTFIYLGA